MRLHILLALYLLSLTGTFACNSSDAPERLEVRLYSQEDLGLPTTSAVPASLRLSVVDRNTEKVAQTQKVGLSSTHGTDAFKSIPFGDNLQIFIEVLDSSDRAIASGGSSHFSIVKGEEILERFFIFLVELNTFAPASGIFQGAAGGPALQINPSPFEDNKSRAGHSAVNLSDGRVLLIGGASLVAQGTGVGLSNIESTHDALVVYDPRNGYFDLVRNGNSIVSLKQSRAYHTTTVLGPNRFLVAGGTSVPVFGDQLEALSSVELVEMLADGTFSVTELPPMANARTRHSANMRADGSILVAGGATIDATSGELIALKTSELFRDGSFTASSDLTDARYDHTATSLADPNLVVICGGLKDTATVLASCELYTQSEDSTFFVAVPSMATLRHGHSAALLKPKGGRYVLLAGGFTTPDTQNPTATYEILDTLEGRFANELVLGTLKKARGAFDLVELERGDDLLIVGGIGIDATGTGTTTLAEGELLSTGTPGGIDYGSTLLPALSDIDGDGTGDGRFDAASVLLTNGMVLVSGGALLRSGISISVIFSDIFNPGPPDFVVVKQ